MDASDLGGEIPPCDFRASPALFLADYLSSTRNEFSEEGVCCISMVPTLSSLSRVSLRTLIYGLVSIGLHLVATSCFRSDLTLCDSPGHSIRSSLSVGVSLTLHRS